MAKVLDGKIALVTGAGRGLGCAFAEHLAGMGCAVAVHGMREHGPAEYGEGTTLTDTAREIGVAYGVPTLRVLADLSIVGQVERLLAEVKSGLGEIDIFVHNAGGDIAHAGGKPDPNDAVMINELDVRSVLGRNLLSTIFTCQRVARSMMERRAGRIITLASGAACGGRANGAVYATAKAAAVQYSRCLAAQLRPFNINVNVISPGDTRTGRFLGTRSVDPTRLAEGGILERIALVDEVARAVEVFAGPLGDFISGQVLRIDGGHQSMPG